MKYRILLLTAMALMVTAVSAKKFTLVIDAGHGGHDTGAVGAITQEKTINLNVALAFGRLVERNCPDVKVIYTRKTDVFVPLHTRADIANHNKADLFISIHTNSLPRGRVARGLETYTLGMHRASDNLDVAKRENAVILIESDYKQRYQGFDPRSSESYIMFEFMQDRNMAQSVELAKFVQRRTCSQANRQDKGVKQAGFLVLRETSMPSCLIELGFISTPDEERYLDSNAGVGQLGQGIYQAFLDYKRKYDTNVTVPYMAEPQQDINVQPIVPKGEPVKAKGKKMKRNKNAELEAAPVDTVPAQVQQPVDTLPVRQSPVEQQVPQPPKEQPAPQPVADSQPVFKVQIVASSSKPEQMASKLKDLKDVSHYEEDGLYKYTVGASTDYNEISQLRKSLLELYPQAFVIAFKNGQKVDVRQAIQEFKNNKKK